MKKVLCLFIFILSLYITSGSINAEDFIDAVVDEETIDYEAGEIAEDSSASFEFDMPDELFEDEAWEEEALEDDTLDDAVEELAWDDTDDPIVGAPQDGIIVDSAILEEEPSDEIIAEGACGAATNWTLYSSGLLIISRSGPTYDFDVDSVFNETTAPWFVYSDLINRAIIMDGIYSILFDVVLPSPAIKACG